MGLFNDVTVDASIDLPGYPPEGSRAFQTKDEHTGVELYLDHLFITADRKLLCDSEVLVLLGFLGDRFYHVSAPTLTCLTEECAIFAHCSFCLTLTEIDRPEIDRPEIDRQSESLSFFAIPVVA